jgi:2-hydroxy-3-oxopropionate reductase
VNTGTVGARNTTKLANQIMVACNIAAMGEALATRCRLDPEVVFNAVGGGLAGSAVQNAKAPIWLIYFKKCNQKIHLYSKSCTSLLSRPASIDYSVYKFFCAPRLSEEYFNDLFSPDVCLRSERS